MTLEQIIKALEGPEPIDTPTADAILDLLRAGQAMRDELVTLKSIQRAPNTAGVKAWDAATQREE